MKRDKAAPSFEMTVDLNVLEHLGINLYSNIAAVLTEAVANAWDADAETVKIRFDTNQEWIEIEDDGIGMSIADLNGKYLRVGYRRRDDADDEQGRAKAAPAGQGALAFVDAPESSKTSKTKAAAPAKKANTRRPR